MKKIALFISMVCLFRVPGYPLMIQVVGTDYPPFTQVNPKSGKAEGFAFDVLEAVFSDLKIDARYTLYPWKRAEAVLLSEPDTMAFLSRNESRENLYYWVGPVYPRTTYLYRMKKRTEIRIRTVSDIKPYKVGVINGYASLSELLEAGVPLNNLDTVANDMINIKKLLACRVDLIPGNDLLTASLLRKEGLRLSDVEKAFVITPEGKNYFYFGVSRKTDKQIVFRMQQVFDKLVRNGSVKKILQKYLR